jgi:hypothetical protein
MFILDPDLDFLPIPDPEVKKSPVPGSGIRNTACDTVPLKAAAGGDEQPDGGERGE